MNRVESMVVARTGTPRASASARSSGGGVSPLVTTKHVTWLRASRARMAERRLARSVRR
jgi:hypothetical protein